MSSNEPRPAVMLYGPPASGKDTITKCLVGANPGYRLFQKVKSGTGSSVGYRMISSGDLDQLRAEQRLAVESHRYGNTYAVDLAHLAAVSDQGDVPIVHLHDGFGIAELVGLSSIAWLTVLLLCPRDETERRLRERGCTNIAQRLDACEEAHHAFDQEPLLDLQFDLCLRTDRIVPETAAKTIDSVLADRFPEHAVVGGRSTASLVGGR